MRIEGGISLWFSVRSQCLCGECFRRDFTTETRRTTELAQRNREANLHGYFFTHVL